VAAFCGRVVTLQDGRILEDRHVCQVSNA